MASDSLATLGTNKLEKAEATIVGILANGIDAKYSPISSLLLPSILREKRSVSKMSSQKKEERVIGIEYVNILIPKSKLGFPREILLMAGSEAIIYEMGKLSIAPSTPNFTESEIAITNLDMCSSNQVKDNAFTSSFPNNTPLIDAMMHIDGATSDIGISNFSNIGSLNNEDISFLNRMIEIEKGSDTSNSASKEEKNPILTISVSFSSPLFLDISLARLLGTPETKTRKKSIMG